MTDTILTYKNFRVRDSDSLNYVVEEMKVAEKGKNIGEVSWRNRGYCTTGKSVITVLERCAIQQAQEEAAAQEKFDFNDTISVQELLNLPAKKGDAK